MNIKAVRSDQVYREIMTAPVEKRIDIYRYELMAQFQRKWDCYNIPLKSAKPGGYDIIMASDMLGYLSPSTIGEDCEEMINSISTDSLWSSCGESIRKSLNCFSEASIELPVQDYVYTLLLANPESPYISLSDGYCGDGGIPGFIFGSLVPNDYTLGRMPVALAHEAAHNVRFQFIKWDPNITLDEMMVNEGLAENFATALYGEENAGPWVTKTDMETLNDYIKPIIYGGLKAQGLAELNSYLYGDDIAKQQNYTPVGLPYCAGYACGYHMIKHFLKKTGISIVDATILPYAEILSQVEDFWE